MPYNPQIVDRSGELFGTGIHVAGAALGGGIERYLEHKKEDEKQRKRELQYQKLLGADDNLAKKMGYKDSIAALSDSSRNFFDRSLAYGAKLHQTRQELENKAAEVDIDPQRQIDADKLRKQQIEIQKNTLLNQQQQQASEMDMSRVLQTMGSPQSGPSLTGEPISGYDQLRTALSQNPHASGAQGFSPAVNALMDTVRPHMTGLEALAPLLQGGGGPGAGGWKPSSIQMGPDGRPRVTLEPPKDINARATEVLTDKNEPTGKAVLPDGRVIDLSPPNMKGTQLSDADMKSITAIDSVVKKLDRLKSRYDELGEDFAGPWTSYWNEKKKKLAGREDPDIAEINKRIGNLLTPYLKGIRGESGVITDADIIRAKSSFPSPEDTPEVRERAFKVLREELGTAKADLLDVFKKGGRDTSKFETPQTQAAPSADDSDWAIVKDKNGKAFKIPRKNLQRALDSKQYVQ